MGELNRDRIDRQVTAKQRRGKDGAMKGVTKGNIFHKKPKMELRVSVKNGGKSGGNTSFG